MRERGNKILKMADRYFGIPLTLVSAGIRRVTRKAAYSSSTAILCLGAIGDLLLASSLANGLKLKNPDLNVEVITSQANASVIPLLADVDRGISFSPGNFQKIISYMRSQQYDLLFDTSQWARIGNILSNLSGARNIVGFITRGQFRGAGYDFAAYHNDNVHELENFIALGKAVWLDFTGSPTLRPPLHTGELKKTIYFHMWPARGSGRIYKLWPENYWASLASILMDMGYRIGLTGGADDHMETEVFQKKFFSGNDRIFSLAGKTDLFTLAGILNTANAVVSVNTGIMHLSALLNTPTIGLHGATNPKRWGPVGKKCISLTPEHGQYGYLNLGFEYPKGVKPAMQYISVDKVLHALESFL